MSANSPIRNSVEEVDAQIEKIRGKIKSASKEDPEVKDNTYGSLSLELMEKRLDQAVALAEGLAKPTAAK